jgi:hypothetical protein
MMIESKLHKNETRKMQYLRTRNQNLQFIHIYFKIQERKDPGRTGIVNIYIYRRKCPQFLPFTLYQITNC